MNKEKIFAYIEQKIDRAFIEKLAGERVPGGITTQGVEQAFKIFRSNASAMLNDMVKEGCLVKIESRPVYFLPRQVLSDYLGSPPQRASYSPDGFLQLIQGAEGAAPGEGGGDEGAFDVIVGNRTNLAEQVDHAKAAILYPPNGLHTLIIGESGTGKTTFAKAMYNYGLETLGKSEKEYPYVEFNCADYYNNPQLLMSQLFGYVKGAFTGADEETVGMVGKADGGVLFLDEIHRLPPQGQELLFYLIDTGQYRKLGESGKLRKAKVLIIGATTENPENVLLKTFARRIPLTICLPPFHQLPIEERLQVVESFFIAESTAIERTFVIKPPVIKALATYEYPGNLGQLFSEIKLLCACTFLEDYSTGSDLTVQFRRLSGPIRESYQKILEGDVLFPRNYDFDITITPSKSIEYSAAKPFDEQKYLALLTNINQGGHADTPRLFILAHGISTASSIADVCNQLTGCNVARGINAPLGQGAEDTYESFISELTAHPRQKGAIVLADMGALLGFGDRAKSETGVPVCTIPNVTTLMALDISRMLCRGGDIHAVYNEYSEKMRAASQMDETGAAAGGGRKDAIFTVCASGTGTSEAFKIMIGEECSRVGLGDIYLEALNYNDVKKKSGQYSRLIKEHNVLAYVGNIDCGLDVPFFHISKLVSAEGLQRFIEFVRTSVARRQGGGGAKTAAELLKEECYEFLNKNVVCVNPDFVIRCALKFIEAIDLPQLRDNHDLLLSFVLHLGFMLERNIVGEKILFDGESEFIERHRGLYGVLREHMRVFEGPLKLQISDAEICYIVQTVQKHE